MSKRSDLVSQKRSYAQFCPLARALDAVGERWTLLLIRNLLVGPLRYSELLDGLPGLTTNLLAKRLKDMTAQGLLQTTTLHGVTLYQLTDRARALESAIFALSSWGESEPFPDGGHRNLRWAMLGLRRRYRGGVCGNLAIESTDPAVIFRLVIDSEEVRFVEDFDDREEARISGEEDAIFALLYGQARFAHLRRQGKLAISGDRRFARDFLRATQPKRDSARPIAARSKH